MLVPPSPKSQLQAVGGLPVLVSVNWIGTPLSCVDVDDVKLAIGTPPEPGPTTIVRVGAVEDSRDARPSWLPVPVRPKLTIPPWAGPTSDATSTLARTPMVTAPDEPTLAPIGGPLS